MEVRKKQKKHRENDRRSYISNILRLSEINQDEIRQWIVSAAAAGLSEWLTEHEKKRLLKLIRGNLNT